MAFPISGLTSIPGIADLKSSAGLGRMGSDTSGTFQAVLQETIHKVEGFRANAAQSVEQFLAGENEDLHRTIMATQRAEIAFDLFLQVRNKVVQAYQEVMRMQM